MSTSSTTPQSRDATFTWYAPVPFAPEQLVRIAEEIARYGHDTLPGRVIKEMAYDGTLLTIVLWEDA